MHFGNTFRLRTISRIGRGNHRLRLDLVEQRVPEPGQVHVEVGVLSPRGLDEVCQELAQLRCEGSVVKMVIQNPWLDCAGVV